MAGYGRSAAMALGGAGFVYFTGRSVRIGRAPATGRDGGGRGGALPPAVLGVLNRFGETIPDDRWLTRTAQQLPTNQRLSSEP